MTFQCTTLQAYSRMERGETSVDMARMQQIAVYIEDILHFDEKRIFVSNNNSGEAKDSAAVHFNLTIHEADNTKLIEYLEKIIERQQAEIESLRAQLQSFLLK